MCYRQMTSCTRPHHILVINFSTLSADPRVLIGRPINCTFHFVLSCIYLTQLDLFLLLRLLLWVHLYLHVALSVSMCYFPMRDAVTNDPRELFIRFLFLLSLCPFVFSLFCPSIALSAALLFLSSNICHYMMVLLFPQESEPDFYNIGSMIECGLFLEALDTLKSAVFPGLLPPAPFLISLLDYAQQVRSELQDTEALIYIFYLYTT